MYTRFFQSSSDFVWGWPHWFHTFDTYCNMRCEEVTAIPVEGRVSLGKYMMYGRRAGLRCRATGTARIFILLHKTLPGTQETPET